MINTADCIVSIEVIAEAVYNLRKDYEHSRQLIAEKIKDFIDIKENLVFGACKMTLRVKSRINSISFA